MSFISKMSSNVRRHLPLLEFLRVAPPKIVKVILKNADDNLISSICEISLNLCKGNIKCSNKKSYNKIKKFRSSLHKLAKARKHQKHLKNERSVLYQKGGAFLPVLLTSVLPALYSYFAQN